MQKRKVASGAQTLVVRFLAQNSDKIPLRHLNDFLKNMNFGGFKRKIEVFNSLKLIFHNFSA